MAVVVAMAVAWWVRVVVLCWLPVRRMMLRCVVALLRRPVRRVVMLCWLPMRRVVALRRVVVLLRHPVRCRVVCSGGVT